MHSSRCLGIVCSSIVGQSSHHFGHVVGYPPPWTMLDAQVYLGLQGISMGLAFDGVPEDGVVEIPGELFALSVGLVRGSNGGVCEIERAGVRFRTPLIHAVLYRGGEWWDPQGDETMKRIERPAELYQLWPVYRARVPEGEMR